MYSPFLFVHQWKVSRDSRLSSKVANQAKHRVADFGEDLAGMKKNQEKLMMVVEALWMLLKAEHGYSDEILNDLIRKIDMKDGKLDGKVDVQPVSCPECGRTIIKGQEKCLYCGKELEEDPFRR